LEQKSEISIEELIRILPIGKKAIAYHCAVDNLPKPIREGKGIGNTYFDRAAVADRLGVNNLDEPFLTEAEAAKYLNTSVAIVKMLINHSYLPLKYYEISAKTGARTLFRKSDLELYKAGKDKNFLHQNKCFCTDKLEFVIGIFDSVLTIGGLSKREQDVMREYYVNGLLQDKIGQKYNLGHERIRQILEKAKLWLRRNIADLQEMQKRLAVVGAQNKVLEAKVNDLTASLNSRLLRMDNVKLVDDIPQFDQRHLPIDVLRPYISVRIWNRLRATSLKTLGDLVKMRSIDVLRFRNLGKRSLAELTELLASRGLFFERE